MGCGCSNARASERTQISADGIQGERLFYQLRKNLQVSKLAEKTEISKEIIRRLTKDCQGFTPSSTGGEITALKEIIHLVDSGACPTEKLVESSLMFVNDVKDNITNIDSKYGRYNKSSSQFLLGEISALDKKRVTDIINTNSKKLRGFLFVIFGAFRYSAGYSFQGDVKIDSNALRFLSKIFHHLLVFRVLNQADCPCFVPSKRQFACVSSFSELKLLTANTIHIQRKKIEKVLLELLPKEGSSSLFPDKTVSVIIDILNRGLDCRSSLPNITSTESRIATSVSEGNPSIIFLTNSSPKVYTRLMIDVLQERQREKISKYEIVGAYHCVKENIVTRNTYFLMLYLLQAFSSKSQIIVDFLKCIEYDIEKKMNNKTKIREKIEDIFLDFCEKISTLRMTHNLVFIIDNAHLLDASFFRIFRHCKRQIPKFLKLVLIVKYTELGQKAISMLPGSQVINVSHCNFFPQIPELLCQKYFKRADPEISTKLSNTINDNMEKLKEIIREVSKIETITKENLLDICNNLHFIGRERKMQKLLDAVEKIKAYKTHKEVEKLLLFFLEARSPLPGYLLEQWMGLSSSTLQTLSDFSGLFQFSSPSKTTLIVPDTVLRLRHKSLWREVLKKQFQSSRISRCKTIIDQCWTSLLNEPVIEMPEYYRLNAVHHFRKGREIEDEELRFLFPEWIYSQIRFFGTFDFVLEEMTEMIEMIKDKSVVVMRNILYVLDNIYTGHRFSFSHFFTHLMGRIMNEENKAMKLLCERLYCIKTSAFRPQFPSIKENNNLEFVQDTSLAVTAIILEENYLIYSTEDGVLFCYKMETYELVYKCFLESGVGALCYIVEGKFILGGMNNSIYLWNLKADPEKNLELKIEGHLDGTKFITLCGSTFFSAGSDNTLKKGNLSPFSSTTEFLQIKEEITQLKALRNPKSEGSTGVLVLVGLINGQILVLDSDMKTLTSIIQSESKIISLQAMRSYENFLAATVDGEINIFETSTFSSVSILSTFHITQDHLVKVLFFESIGIMVSIERRKLRFFKPTSGILVDEWIYFFKGDIILAKASDDEKYLVVADNYSKICVFDMQKSIETRFSLGVPSHRSDYGVQFILHTGGIVEQQQRIITCSPEREIKVWSRESCKFIKKYNLSSICSDVITAATMDQANPNLIYIGSKDTNIYKVDLSQGMAYEPLAEQYTKVSQLKTIRKHPQLLICVAEKNILIWSTKSRHPIMEFSIHKNNIIYIGQYKGCGEEIESVDSGFVYIHWDWETNEVLNSLSLFPQSASYLEEEIGLMCTIIKNLIFIATNKGFIRVFSVKEEKEIGSIMTEDNELPISLESNNLGESIILLVVTKTVAEVYKVEIKEDGRVLLDPMAGVRINSTIQSTGISRLDKYVYDLYFTCASILIFEEEERPVEMGVSGMITARDHMDTSIVSKSERQEKLEESKLTTKLNVTQLASTTLGNSLAFKSARKKNGVTVYLADSKAFLHVYNLFENSVQSN